MTPTDLQALANDGDSLHLDGGTLTLHIPYDGEGRDAEEQRQLYGIAYSPRVNGYSQRPEGFNGAALKLTPWLHSANSRHGDYWLQPEPNSTPDQIDAQRKLAVDILEYGYSGIRLTWQPDGHCPHCDQPPPEEEASLWGIETCSLWDPDGYLREVVTDLAAELGLI